MTTPTEADQIDQAYANYLQATVENAPDDVCAKEGHVLVEVRMCDRCGLTFGLPKGL